jgi:hypothetical protein
MLEHFPRWSRALRLVSRDAQRSAPLRVAANRRLTMAQHEIRPEPGRFTAAAIRPGGVRVRVRNSAS